MRTAMVFRPLAAACVFLAVLLPPAAGAARDPDVAALQVGMRARGVYAGAVDGELGPATIGAARTLLRGAGVPAERLVGPRTRAALGRFGRPRLGSRPVVDGSFGWDAAAVQFMLAWHGFPSGDIDGAFGPRSVRALRKFQRWARLAVDGVAGQTVLSALRAAPPACPISLRPPMTVPSTDGFGPRGARFHTGLDYPAPTGARVTAAGPGVVTWAGPLAGGWGTVVTIEHTSGVRTLYAHLSAVRARVGQRVPTGQLIGLVGATGHAFGPHLHFEVQLRGAALDPLGALRPSATPLPTSGPG